MDMLLILLDAYMFMQINDGNAIALPFAKGFGWGAELNLTYIFEKLFEGEPGGGYPKERVVPEQRNKKILDGVRAVTLKQDLVEVLKELDQDLVKGAVAVRSSKNFSLLTARMRRLLSMLRLSDN